MNSHSNILQSHCRYINRDPDGSCFRCVPSAASVMPGCDVSDFQSTPSACPSTLLASHFPIPASYIAHSFSHSRNPTGSCPWSGLSLSRYTALYLWKAKINTPKNFTIFCCALPAFYRNYKSLSEIQVSRIYYYSFKKLQNFLYNDSKNNIILTIFLRY